MNYRYPLTLVLVVLVAGLSPAIAANLAVNGSFEAQDVPTNSYASTDYTFSPGWSLLPFISDGNGGTPSWWGTGGSVGPQYGDIGNRNSGVASYDFTVPSGFVLDSITWDDATAAPVSSVQYTVNLQTLSGSYNAPGINQNWQAKSLPITPFIYGPGNYTLEFDVDSGNPTGWDVLIDNLVIETERAPEALYDLGDLVWDDLNGDGIQDNGEPGLANVTVNLLDNVGGFISSDLTDASGNFLFSGLTDGAQYELEFILLSGYTFSPEHAGANPLLDSDANVATGRTGLITLTADDYSQDAGMVPEPASLMVLLLGGSLLAAKRRRRNA